MRAAQLEGLVLNAIDALRNGPGGEDDRVEFKRDWPEPSKARQLAAAANRLNGEPLVYVIGIDDRNGSIHPTSDIDAADWWPRMEAIFDEVAPELSMHLTVRVAENQSVVALLFQTDRAPYLVKVTNGGATEREVPIREGSRTRSARRHELLRLLLPHVQLPQLHPVSGTLGLGAPDYYGGDSEEIAQITLGLSLFFEYPIADPVFLPFHIASAIVMLPNETLAAPIHIGASKTYIPNGVNARSDGIQVAGPGVVFLTATWKEPHDRHGELAAIDPWHIRLEFGIAGSDRKAAAEMRFAGRQREPSTRLLREGKTPLDTCTWNLA